MSDTSSAYAFLAPEVVQIVLKANHSHELTLEKLKLDIPMNWREQQRILLHSSKSG